MSFSRYYLCDLQVHTPADQQHGYGNVPTRQPNAMFARQLIDAHVQAGVQVIAVTDHNRVDWYPLLAEAGAELGVTVFPGVEINVNRCHVLGIWDCTPQGYDLCQVFLQTLWEPGETPFTPNGDPRPVARGQVRDIVERISQHKGICLAPHSTASGMGLFARGVYSDCGELAQRGLIHGFDVSGNRNADVLINPRTKFGSVPPRWFITGDVRSFSDVGACAVYLKLGASPSLEGLRQAFLASNTRIRFPSHLASQWGHVPDISFLDNPTASWPRITSVAVMGGFHDGLSIKFGPGLNAVIGGKGTGKSALIEIIRYVLDAPAPIEADLKQNLVENFRANAEASLSVVTSTGESYVINRSGDNTPSRLLHNGDDTDVPVTRRFRARVFGQRELQTLIQQQELRRQFLAQSVEAQWDVLQEEADSHVAKIAQLERQLDANEQAVAGLEDLKHELADLREMLARAQDRGVEGLINESDELVRASRMMDDAIKWPGTVENVIDVLAKSAHAPRLPDHPLLPREVGMTLNALQSRIEHVVADLRLAVDDTEDALQSLKTKWLDASARRRHEIDSALADAGISNLQEINQSQRRVSELEEEIERLANKREFLQGVERQRQRVLSQLVETRRKQSRLLDDAARQLSDSVGSRVRIRTEPMADRSRLVQIIAGHLKGQNVRGDHIEALAKHSPTTIAKAIVANDTSLDKLGCSPSLAAKLRGLTPKALRSVELAEIADNIVIEINLGSTTSESWVSLDHVSPGQRATAMLALALASGNDPLIIDQPEDDLDNRYIYDEVVKVISRVCENRQVIVATHNANIPILGDAEMVVALDAMHDRSKLITCGGLEDSAVAEAARNILEGGDEAFRARQRRYLAVN